MRARRDSKCLATLTPQELDQVTGGSIAEGLSDIREGIQDLIHGSHEGVRDIREGVGDILHAVLHH